MIACFDIGGSFIKFGLSDAAGLVPELGRVPTPRDDFGQFTAAIATALEQMNAPRNVPVSISLAGFADPHTGTAVVANVPCLNGKLLAEELGAQLGRAVSVHNDADCFALAEARLGAGAGHRNVFAIILGSGVGGGLVINGALVEGFGGIAGEWGHGPIVDPGAGGLIEPLPRVTCGCGRTDCLDPVGSARGLEHLYRSLGGDEQPSTEILSRWRDGDGIAATSVQVFIEHLARVLGLIVNVTGVSIVPVGGGLGAAPDLIAALDERVRALSLARHRTPLVVPGQRAADGGLVGAALVVETQGVLAA